MVTKIQKWGNSLALRIPKVMAQDLELVDESEVELSVSEGRLVIEPVTLREWTLEELLAGITPDNIHAETDTGAPVGHEVW